MKADLHTHTTCSDGTYSPKDLLDAAKKAGLDVLSITDHDTLRAYELLPERCPVKLISGLELSASFGVYGVHLLAYSFKLNDPGVRQLCDEQIVRREKRNEQILDRLAQLGYPIKPEELLFTPSDEMGSIGRPHIAKALMTRGYVSSIREAFDRLIAEEGPAFVAGARCTVDDVLDVIHAANGFVVIAHPQLIREKNLLEKLLKCPFDGLEAHYANFSQGQAEEWAALAKKAGFFATGGSDFHGDVKPNGFLGSSLAPVETLNLLLARSSENNESL